MKVPALGAIAVAAVVLPVLPRAAAPQRGLTATPAIARAYNAIFDARFDDLPQTLRGACVPGGVAQKPEVAPREVCQVLAVVGLWWEIQLDPLNTSRDVQFQRDVGAAIAVTEAWTTREPDRAEAWFYRGAAYGARVQWRVLRGERVAAARDGKRIKDALELALVLDPSMHDAWFGIGLYHYYADVAPAAAKVLRWLLLLPGGDRVQGMNEMLRARENGAIMRSEADYQLHVLYLWYEKQPQQALRLLEELRRRHTSNPHFLQLIAEIQDTYLHDLTASLRSWQTLLEEAQNGQVTHARMAATQARLGIARQRDRLFETDVAIDHLRAVVDSRPTAPFGALADAHLQLGQALDRMGDRAGAAAEYRAAIASVPAGDPSKVAIAARNGLRKTTGRDVSDAYRLSIEGWRALEDGRLTEASRALERSLALQPQDPVTQYRWARLRLARKDIAGALQVLDAITAARAATPPTIYAAACLDAAEIYAQQGDRERALDLYRTVDGVFGADHLSKNAARQAITRLLD